MAIALDTSNGVRNSTGGTTTLSSFVVAAGSNKILIAVTTAQDGNHANYPVTGITWNATENFTKVRSDEPVGNVRTEIWYLLAPTSTTANVVATFTGSLGECSLGCVSLNGVSQVAPEANNGTTGSGATPSISLTTVANNAWSVSISSAEDRFTAINNSQVAFTGYPLIDQSFENAYAGYRGPITPAGPTTLSYTLNSGQTWAISSVSMAPSGGAAVTNTNLLLVGIGT